MENNMKELPKTFYNAKREFEKSFNFAISKAKDDNKDKELENYAVLFALIQEFNNFLFKYEEEVSVALKDRMDDLKKYKVFLSDFEKKVHYDDEASWLFVSDMNSKDYSELTKIQNDEFLRKRAENKVLNGDF
jgi:hypothetical protein